MPAETAAWRAWLRGLDPPIYLLALFPPAVGAATTHVATDPSGWSLGLPAQPLPWPHALAAASAFLLIHVAVNVFNDAFDAATPADRVKVGSLARIAPVRFLHSLASVCLVCGIAIGITLWLRVGGWHIPLLGAVGVVLVFAYHAPPLRLSARGGGELVTFLGFGALPVWTTAALADGRVPGVAVPAGVAVGLAAALVLWHHNVASAAQDGAAGKRTLAVRLGRLAPAGTLLVTGGALAAAIVPWGPTALVPALLLGATVVAARRLAASMPRAASLATYSVLAGSTLLVYLLALA